jgi:hypothetical protein
MSQIIQAHSILRLDPDLSLLVQYSLTEILKEFVEKYDNHSNTAGTDDSAALIGK